MSPLDDGDVCLMKVGLNYPFRINDQIVVIGQPNYVKGTVQICSYPFEDNWKMNIHTVSFGDIGPVLWNRFEEVVEKTKTKDMINSPNHYILFNKDEIEGDSIEVKHVVKAILERWESQENISFDFYQAGCYKELLQYLLRAPLKNNIEDVQKAEYYLKEIINEW